jgi:hypothetical protein
LRQQSPSHFLLAEERLMRQLSSRQLALLTAATALLALARPALACPFCSAVSITLGEEMKGASAAVIARLADLPQPAAAPDPAKPPVAVESKARFDIAKVLKGKDILGDTRQIEAIYFGQDEKGKPFLIMGVDKPQVVWNTPIPLTERAVEYVSQLPDLPESGPDRLAYFEQYLEDTEEMLARDAYDEFARAPYAEVKGLKDRMDHGKLLTWIKKSEVPPSRRRLYLTMLGVCGSKDDVPLLERILRSDDRDMKTALDAVIACYLTLAGPDGLPLVEDRFLKNADAEYTDTYAAIMALRFHGQEESILPKERLVKSLEYMLDRPQLADLVIPDLARWQDWQVMDRLVKLFKEANEETSWVRVPVINFLKACPDPRAKTYIDELARIDPDAVKRASSAFPFAGAVPAPVPAPDATAAAATAPAEAPAQTGPNQASNAASVDTVPTPAAEAPTTSAGAGQTSTESTATAQSDDARLAQADERDDTNDAAAVAAQAEPLVEPPRFTNTPVWLVVIVPLVAGLLLLGIFVVVLRGQRRQTT